MKNNCGQILQINWFNYKLYIVLFAFITICSYSGKSQEMKLTEIKTLGTIPIKLYILNGGEINVPDMSMFGTGEDPGTEVNFSNTTYLVIHPKGNLLWDTGLPDSICNTKERIQMMNGAFSFYKEIKLIAQLKELGLAPEDIDYLSFTNLHPVFVGNISYFKNAEVLIQEREYTQAFSKGADKQGYNLESYKILKEMNIKMLNGHYDVFGDGSFIILHMPASSDGHQTFFIDLPETGPVITAGDLFAYQKRRDEYSVPPFIVNKRAFVKSFVQTDELLEQTGATLWLNHDIEQYKALKYSSKIYK